jgi:adenylate cyclase
LTDASQEQVAEHVRNKNLTGPAAESCFDDQARETLATVNLYLGLIANVIISNHGTVDKFIGDCVMAFWGAPTPNPRHALSCVRAALSAQRAVNDLNLQREKENVRRREENLSRQAKGLDPQPMLPTLSLGTGINTGLAVAGLMGSSESESLSYTVFGREVNLASRLEGASGRGRIFISASTYSHLAKDDPALAATCIPLEPLKVKGFRNAVEVYEVPWLQGEAVSAPVSHFPPRQQSRFDSVMPCERLFTRAALIP